MPSLAPGPPPPTNHPSLAGALWDLLTLPRAEVTDPLHRSRARTLAATVVTVLPPWTILAVVSAAGRPEPVGPIEAALFFALSGAAVLAYGLSRTRHYPIGAALLALAGTLGGVGAAFLESQPQRIVASLTFTVSGVMYAAFFLSRRAAIGLGATGVVLTLITALIHPRVSPAELALAPALVSSLIVLTLVGSIALHEGLATIRAQSRQLRELVEMAPVGVAIVRQRRITFANASLLEALGRTSEEVVGASLTDLMAPEDEIRLRQTSPPTTHELRLRGRGGHDRIVEASLTSATSFTGKLFVARDVTDQRAIRDQLLLTERLASLGTIAASVGHEINNPLTYVLINLDFIRSEMGDLLADREPTSRVQELLSVLGDTREGAKRASEIVTELKSFVRTDDEATEVDVGKVLSSSLRVAAAELRHRARVIESWGALPKVWGQSSRLGQVFLNLIVNAAHSIPPGASDRNQIQVRARTDPEGWVVIEIEDSGSGIPEDLRTRIFEPFFTTKPAGMGTGLGLPICLKIVRELGGSLEVDSEVGVGSTFRVRLPPSRVHEQPAPDVESRRTVSGARVLVVEDERGTADAIRRLLRGYAVEVASNGEDALRACRARHFDAIVCDLMLPKRSGWDLYAALKVESPGLEDRMIFVTAGAGMPEARAFLATVANRVLEKPFDARELRSAVAETCLHRG